MGHANPRAQRHGTPGQFNRHGGRWARMRMDGLDQRQRGEPPHDHGEVSVLKQKGRWSEAPPPDKTLNAEPAEPAEPMFLCVFCELAFNR